MKRIRSEGIPGWLVVLALAAGATDARGDEAVFKKGLPSMTWVLSQAKDGLSEGSGVLVDQRRRLLMTAYHVVGDRQKVVVFFPARDDRGELVTDPRFYLDRRDKLGVGGRVVAGDPASDLALIELESIPASARAATIASIGPQPGQEVFAIGNSGSDSGVLWRYLDGRVRQVYRKRINYSGGQKVEARIVEMTVPFNAGDSGGAVLNARGELVAITSGRTSKEVAVDYGIDVEEIRAMLGRDLKANPAAEADPAGPAARVADLHVDHNIVRGGRQGLVAHFRLSIDRGRGLPCDILLVVCDAEGRPIRSRVAEFADAGGNLGASIRVTPTRDDSLFDDVTVFVPYDAIDASIPRGFGELIEPPGVSPTPMTLGSAVDVREVMGNRWLLGKPAWSTFKFNREAKDAAGDAAPGL